MIEREVKILEIDKDKVVSELKRLGAEKVYDGDLFTKYFDYPSRLLKKEGKTLRLRKFTDRSVLTFKKKLPTEGVKEREETEVIVEGDMDEIFKGLGLELTREKKKYRTSLILDKARIDIDTYPGIPTFLEIEGDDKEKIFSTAEKLGFKREDCLDWHSDKLFGYYGYK
ncbi:MAG: class IV adenylate cyclase [Nanobdellota archaeon]